MSEKRYLANELRVDGNWYAVNFIAENEPVALAFCERNGFQFCGEVHAIIPCPEGTTPEDAAQALDEVTERRNRQGRPN